MLRTTFAVTAACLACAAPAAAKDYAPDALNIIPSGQYGGMPVPAGADQQALMYDGLTPLFDQVTAPDLTKYFKSEALGAAAAPGPTRVRVHAPQGPQDRARRVQRAAHHRQDPRRRDLGQWLGDRGGPRAAARPGPLRRAHGRPRRPGHQRLLARHRPQAGDGDEAGRQDHRQAADGRAEGAGQGRPRAAPRHRRLRGGHQRAAAGREVQAEAVDARGRVLDQRARRADLRPGWRRRGAAVAAPRRAAQAARRRTRADGLQRPLGARRPGHSGHDRQELPVREDPGEDLERQRDHRRRLDQREDRRRRSRTRRPRTSTRRTS